MYTVAERIVRDTKPMLYHTLLVRDTDDGQWYVAFGDYLKSVVKEEVRLVYGYRWSSEYKPLRNRMIISHLDNPEALRTELKRLAMQNAADTNTTTN